MLCTSVSGRGLFRDGASDAMVRQVFFDGTTTNRQIVVPYIGTIRAAFKIAALKFSGEHNSEVIFDIALESAGALSTTAL